MAAVLQAQDAPAAKVLQPADNPDVDVVPLRFGVKYASDAPMLALEYRDKASGELRLEEIPLAIKDDSKALEVYAALKESHARFLAPYVVSVAQVVRLIQLAIDNRGKVPMFGRHCASFSGVTNASGSASNRMWLFLLYHLLSRSPMGMSFLGGAFRARAKAW